MVLFAIRSSTNGGCLSRRLLSWIRVCANLMSSMRFEVKHGDKGGIFWQKEKGKPQQRKFGYKTKGLRHPIRRPEPEYIEEPKAEKPRPSKDFIRKNREQYHGKSRDNDKENEHSVAGSRPSSSSIKPGTVTLTQDQLNALLTTVGKLKPGEGNNIRISIDAESNRLQVDSPRDNLESAPNSNRSNADYKGSAKEEIRDSSGYGSEEKSSGGGGKEVRFDTARNQEKTATPEPSPAPPPMVPWRHMTVAERKRLQWAREKEAEQELQRQRDYGPWGRPQSESPQKQPDPEPKANTTQPTEPEETHQEKIRKAIDAIEAKYGDLLNLPSSETKEDPPSSSPPLSKQSRSNSKVDKGKGNDGRKGEGRGDKASVMTIPGLDTSYSVSLDQGGGDPGTGGTHTNKQREDRGNTRPPRRPDRKDAVPTREGRGEERRRDTRKPGRKPAEEERGGGEGGGRREEERRRERERREEGRSGQQGVDSEAFSSAAAATASPAAMQNSLFIGSTEPDTSQFLSKKEKEKKEWLEGLDQQREEKRLQKQKEKEREREGVDDRWADRFVSPSSRPPPPPPPQQQQSQLQSQPKSYSTTTMAGAGDWERPSLSGEKDGSAETSALAPAAMRSAMTVGNVAPNVDMIQQKQAEDRRKWLEDLNKQREEQREARMRLKDKQREPEDTWANRFTYNDAPPPRPETNSFQHAAPPPPAASSVTPSAGQFKDPSASGRVGSAPQPDVSDSLDQEAK